MKSRYGCAGSSGRMARPRSRQRGAIAMMTAVFLFLGIMCLVLVVDTGRLYFEQRRLQRVADTTALDTATQGGLCNVAGTSLVSLARDSATRNGYTGDVGVAPNRVTGGYLNTAGGIRSFVADSSNIEAVQVHLQKQVPASLIAGGIFGGQVNLQAQATARRVPVATFSAGSGLLNVDTAKSALLNPLLTSLLGTSSQINLNAVAYQGVVDADVSLLDILQSAGLIGSRVTVGAVDTALDTQITLAGFVDASINALDDSGVANVGLLRSQLIGIRNATLRLSDIVAVDAAPGMVEEALKANVNVLELIMAAAMAANKGNAVALNSGVSGLGLSLRVVEPPRIASGAPGRNANGDWTTEARTAQVQLTATMNNAILNIISGSMALSVNVAQGRAWFEEARCRTLATGQTDINLVGQTALVSMRLGNTSGTGDALIQANVIVPVLEAQVGLTANIGQSAERDLDYAVANKKEELPEMKSMSSGNGLHSSISQLNVHDLKILGINLGLDVGALLAPLRTLLIDSILNNVLNPVVVPLLALLGVAPGTMDVTLLDVQDGPAVLVE
ncbi:MAG TPA: TadG family pilus assembly protein [Moraxellaceae bacterium]